MPNSGLRFVGSLLLVVVAGFPYLSSAQTTSAPAAEAQVAAKTPEQITSEYFEFLRQHDWEGVAGLFDSTSLKEFRELMSWIQSDEVGEVRDSLYQALFGPDADAESVARLSDESYFASLLAGVMQQVAALGGLDFEKLEVLGSLPEGDDVVHVVTRATVTVGEIEGESMEVISFRQREGGWKILPSGKLKGIPAQLKAMAAAGP